MEKYMSLKHQTDINGYLFYAYPYTIVNTYPEFKQYLFDNYIQSFGYVDDSGALTFDYEDGISYNHLYYHSGPLEFHCIPYNIGIQMDIVHFLKQELNQNNYIIIFLDEYYLKGRSSYKKTHFVHEIMITGYRNNVFTYYAFNENFKLSFAECTQNHLAKAYKQGKKVVLRKAINWISQKSIMSINVKPSIRDYEYSKVTLARKLSAYYIGVFQKEYEAFIMDSSRCFIGVHNTQAIISCMTNDESRPIITYPAVHSWYESKRNLLTKMRVVLSDIAALNDLFSRYETDIVKKADIIRMNFLKQRRNGKINADNTLTLLNELYSREKDIIGQILESINES